LFYIFCCIEGWGEPAHSCHNGFCKAAKYLRKLAAEKSDVLKLEYKDYKTNEFYSYSFTNYPYIAISQSCMHGKEKL
jgi:hypothetical protein